MKILTLLFTASFFLNLSCKETPDLFQVELGKEYFPLAVGKYVVYEVDSTVFDPTGDSAIIYSTTFVKEEIVDTLHDNLSNTLYKIERSERKNETQPWQTKKVLTASIQEFQAIRTEDNLRFIKLVFPLKKNKTWDGNIYFDPSIIVTVAGESLEMFKSWDYKILSVGQAETIGDTLFDEVTTVQQAESENLIELRQSIEKYAKGIGLIYREAWILDTQCIEGCIGKTWHEKAEKGFILIQKMKDHN